MLLWRLRLQENPDHMKFSSLYNTAVVTFFHISTHADIVDVQITPKKSSRATLINHYKIITPCQPTLLGQLVSFSPYSFCLS